MTKRKQPQPASPGLSSSPTGEKLPPRNVEAEESVLASIMVDAAADDQRQMETLSQFLKPEHFYREQHGWIWQAMLDLYVVGKPLDQISICQQLSAIDKLEAIGGPGYLSLLISRLPTSLHAVFYGNLVKRLAVCRKIIDASGAIANIGYSANGDSVENILQQAQGYLEVIWTEIAEQPLVISNLKKSGRETPMYYLDINSQKIKVDAETLISYKKLREKVLQLCDFVPPKMKEEEWLARVNRLLKTVEKDPGPAETSQEHNIWMGARNLLMELMPTDNLEEFLTGKPLEKGECLYIKGIPFYNAVKQKLKMPTLLPTPFWAIMKDHGAKDTTTRIGGKHEGCWRIPQATLEEKVEEGEEPGFLI